MGEFQRSEVVDSIFGEECVLDLGQSHSMCAERKEADDKRREKILEILFSQRALVPGTSNSTIH